jgi:uncharacterized protein YegP (UPF0339 family)
MDQISTSNLPPIALHGRKPSASRLVEVSAAAHFEVYRDEPIRLTTTLFSPSHWHWRLCSDSGDILAVSEGYQTEQTCRSALAALCHHAASAPIAN